MSLALFLLEYIFLIKLEEIGYTSCLKKLKCAFVINSQIFINSNANKKNPFSIEALKEKAV